MKSISRHIIFLIALIATSIADDQVIRALKVLGGEFELIKNKEPLKVTTLLRIKGGAVIWSREYDISGTGRDTLEYSNLVAIRRNGDVICALLSTAIEGDYLWIRAEYTKGSWKTVYEQKLVGIASQKLRTKSIELPSIDVVRITSGSGEATSFTRTDQGGILRNGQPYAN